MAPKSIEEDDLSVASELDSDGHDSTTTGQHTTTYGSDKEAEEHKMNLAKKETVAVFRLRLLVFCVLLLAAVAVSVIVYFVTARSEKEQYETQYEGASKKVLDTFLSIITVRMASISSLGVALMAHGIDHVNDYPFVTLTSFQQRASTARSQSGALLVQWNPLVHDSVREQWEEYVVGEDSKWIGEGLEYQQDIGLYDFYPNITEKWGEYEPRTNAYPIWSFKNPDVANPIATMDRGPGPYLPAWEVSPVIKNGEGVNENFFNNYVTASAARESYSTGSVVIGDFQYSDPGYYDSENAETSKFATLLSIQQQTNFQYRGDPLGKIFFPIFSSFKKEKTTGVLVALLHWKSYFRDILPHNIKGINYVLSQECKGKERTSFTYELVGDDVKPLGLGDLHEQQFNNMKRSADYSHVEGLADGTKSGLRLNLDRCSVHIDVYPSQKFYDSYNTGMPIIMTCAVAIIFVFTALMFLFYDRLVERRQRIVLNKAITTNKIVASLFPANVRDRLMQQAEAQAEAKMKKNGEFVAPNHRLKGYLQGQEEDDMNETPIADLFPHCTVLFADIAGFTAWSSTRDPAQVFILLQTVYQAFDKIAKRRKVFKVETIGDSYVAVTGLPEPQPTHAVIMTRFAGECLLKMNELTSRLESSLGPDTGDLSMRFGLHSGPVTAGVLRGERARFQLFGDTVNTAARIESTGVKNRIQCSTSTHTLLVAAGKESWTKPRDEAVTAKGKGTLKTFWLNPNAKKGNTSSVGSSSVSGLESSDPNSNSLSQLPNSTVDISHAAKVIKRESITDNSNQKQERLVDWITDMLHEHVRKLVALRKSKTSNSSVKYSPPAGKTSLDEVAEVIYLPRFSETAFSEADDYRKVQIDTVVMSQLREFVGTVASWYRNNPFHNFEHACHVTMAVNKFLKRIIAPDIAVNEAKKGDLASKLHDYTHGINSDPLTILAIVFSALIHDVDHQGVSNVQLGQEMPALKEKYHSKSLAEQNSLDISWDLLMQDKFAELRKCLFTNESELMRFRQVLVNVVLATDIFDPELNGLRKNRWNKAFSEAGVSDEENNDLRATIVIEHIIQASDVAHTMQHWHIYRKWNKRLFKEMYYAYLQGRMGKDPSTFWYNGEIGFFDNYVIPLAKKLKDCNVFGVSSDECLNYATQNRDEWIEKGKEIVEELLKELGVESQESAP